MDEEQRGEILHLVSAQLAAAQTDLMTMATRGISSPGVAARCRDRLREAAEDLQRLAKEGDKNGEG